MIGYICKYAPIDIIESFGEETIKIHPEVNSFSKANTLTHDNMCSYSKAIIEECFNKNIDKLILTNCCDSIRRLYDVLVKEKNLKFIYLIDIPRKINDLSYKLYEKELNKLICELEKYLNKSFSLDNLLTVIESKKNTLNSKSEHIKTSRDSILIMGARLQTSLLNTIKSSNYNFIDTTCTNYNLDYENINTLSKDNLLEEYSKTLLCQFPCMRMCDTHKRYELVKNNNSNIKGIIYHTLKFCDYYSFDYAQLKSLTSIPILKLETDFLIQSQGQISTRLEAFMESLKKSCKCEQTVSPKDTTCNYFAGIDSGSTSTNAVIINSENHIVSCSVVKTGAKSIEGAYKALDEALKKCNLKRDDIKYIVSTGYGRTNINFSKDSVTEITCHAKGAYYINNDVKTIIDIGGQDSKVISLDSQGNVREFAMNDKCAAGTGRFLENMCKVLDISIEDIGEEYLKWNKDLTITSMCTVFAESEVVSLIAENKDTPDIVHGICKSVSTRVLSLFNRVNRNNKEFKANEIMMTGGVAKNIGVVKTLEELLGQNIYVPDEPQIIGALGAALFAKEKFLNNEE